MLLIVRAVQIESIHKLFCRQDLHMVKMPGYIIIPDIRKPGIPFTKIQKNFIYLLEISRSSNLQPGVFSI